MKAPEVLVMEESQGRLSVLKLICLTCSTGGLQMVWSTIMSNGTPFLITLGLPESLTALIWIAAPLCGVIIQPYIGMLSDQSQHPWGRRRPFIAVGAIGVIICILCLASTRTVVNSIILAMHGDIHSNASMAARILFAITWLYALNIFIQPLQGGNRALIVDNCPAEQQADASAYASLMTGLGNMMGYFFGFVNVKDVLGLHNITQFTWLCMVASTVVAMTVTTTCLTVKEQDPSTMPIQPMEATSVVHKFRHLIWSFRTMPEAIQKVCVIQFFAWMAWFPFLFYITSFVGDMYAAPRLSAEAHMSSEKQAAIIEDAVRSGSLASLSFATVTFCTNMVLPRFIGETSGKHGLSQDKSQRRFSITKAWSISHFFFAGLMFSTIFVSSRLAATTLFAFVGISWAFTLWVPFTIIGQEIAERRSQNANVMQGELQPTQQDQAGTIMGLHNCAISAPQIIAALTSSIIFWLTKKFGIDNGIGWVLRAGGLAAIVAGCFARRLER